MRRPPLLAAADWGVDDADAALGALGGQVGRHVRADRAGVDVQQASFGVGEDAVLAEGHALDVGRVGKHGDDDVGTGDRFRDTGRAPAARGDEPLDRLRMPVIADDRVACLDEVGRHRAAHDAKPVPGSFLPGASAICT
jgi:hypothetical protein